MGYIGESVRRKEDLPLLTGRGKYTADFNVDDCLHAAIVRSPHALAELGKIDSADAQALPGVFAVVTWQDISPPPPPIPVRVFPSPSVVGSLQYPLAHDRVRYVGEPVAVVLAGNRYVAEDAAERIFVEYKPMQPAVDVHSALVPDAPQLFEGVPGNVAYACVIGNCDASIWKQAVATVRERFHTNRHMACPLETRGLLADYDPTADRITVWGPTKALYWNRSVLAQMLRHGEGRIRFVEPHVGGAFGLRGEFYPEDFLIPYCAKRFRRPIKWVEDRREHLLAANHSREQTYEVEMAAAADGKILGARVRLYHDLGAYMRTNGTVPAMLAASCFAGPYAFPFVCEIRCVLTSKTPVGTYRSPGHFESAFVRERLMDIVAARLGIDPADIRRRNLIKPEQMPFDVGTSVNTEPVVLDRSDYPFIFERALEVGRYEEFRRQRPERLTTRELVGIGLGCFVEKTGLGEWEYGRAELQADGRIALYTGGTSVGQGIETVLSQIVAEFIGVSYENVRVRHGDTEEVTVGNGAWASRGTIHAGNCAREVAMQLRNAILRAAAEHLEAAPHDIEITNDRVFVRGARHRALTLAEIASRSGPGGIVCEHIYRQKQLTYTMGVHVARVAVDLETGQVRLLGCDMAVDVGRAVNPLLVRGQAVGGLAQGIGGALLEELTYNSNGQLLTGTLMDYLLPTAEIMPPSQVSIIENPSPTNPLGVRGAGECGAAGVGAAIANAVADALRSAGVKVEIARLPLSPDRIWSLLAAQGLVASGKVCAAGEAGG